MLSLRQTAMFAAVVSAWSLTSLSQDNLSAFNGFRHGPTAHNDKAGLSSDTIDQKKHSDSAWSLLSLSSTTNPPSQQKCLKMLTPVPGQFVADTVCSVCVAASCRVHHVTFQAAYLSNDKRNIEVVSLGKALRPPYCAVWNVQSIPNQLYEGATVRATVLLEDSSVQEVVAKGIFVFRSRPSPPRIKIPYCFHNKPPSSLPLIRLISLDSMVMAETFFWWNDSGLFFSASITDSFFQSEPLMDAEPVPGVEILFDPDFSLSAFPMRRAGVVAFPVSGQSYRVNYFSTTDSVGAFSVQKAFEPLACRHIVQQVPFGYKIDGSVPVSLFGSAFPDSIAFNFVVKYRSSSSKVQELSWATSSEDGIYSPCMWGRLIKGPRLSPSILILSFIASAVVGFVAAFMCSILFLSIKRSGKAHLSHAPQDALLERGNEAMLGDLDRLISDVNLSLRTFAESTGLSQSQVQRRIKKATGMSFSKYLIHARVELAKERLRSSHTNEVFIAESCGFHDVGEMRRYFRMLCKMTPDQYRSRYHVD